MEFDSGSNRHELRPDEAGSGGEEYAQRTSTSAPTFVSEAISNLTAFNAKVLRKPDSTKIKAQLLPSTWLPIYSSLSLSL